MESRFEGLNTKPPTVDPASGTISPKNRKIPKSKKPQEKELHRIFGSFHSTVGLVGPQDAKTQYG